LRQRGTKLLAHPSANGQAQGVGKELEVARKYSDLPLSHTDKPVFASPKDGKHRLQKARSLMAPGPWEIRSSLI
jgi:hypothetical protein